MKRNIRIISISLVLLLAAVSIYLDISDMPMASPYRNLTTKLGRPGDMASAQHMGSYGKNNVKAVSPKKMETVSETRSREFIRAAFDKNKARVSRMIAADTAYVQSPDGSSFIRYSKNGQLVEGYMATDKKLSAVKQRWYLMEKDGTLTSGMEVYIAGQRNPQLWFLHFRKVGTQWKLYMLENGM